MQLIRGICCHLGALFLGTKEIYAGSLMWLIHNPFYFSMLCYSYLNGDTEEMQVASGRYVVTQVLLVLSQC